MNLSQVETEYSRLKEQFEAGTLTEQEFKSQLHDLMLQDERGDWWVIGYETGQWYRHDGTDWVRADPPGHAQADIPQPPLESPQEQVPSKLEPKPSEGGLKNWYAVGLVSIGWGITWGIALSAPWWSVFGYLFDEGGIGIIAALCGALSGLVCGLVVRWILPAIRWHHILLIAAGWAIGLGVTSEFLWSIVIWDSSIEINEIITLIIIGGIGGSTTGLTLKWADPRTNWQNVIIIAGGWTLAIGIGVILSPNFHLPSELFSVFVRFLVTGLVIGAIGAGIMFWQLGQLQNTE